MRILVPVDRPWEIVGNGVDDVAVAFDGLVLRTVLRTGTLMVREAVLSTPTDRRTVAALAARSLLIETTVFAGSRAENRAAMEAVSVQADVLAATGGDWEPLDVDGTTFALWTTRFDAGVAAAADLGPCVLAAWSADASARLPALTLVDAPE